MNPNKPRQIIFFETDSGKTPIFDYIEQAERFRRERAKILLVFQTVENFQILPSNIFKKLKNAGDLWEIRVLSHRFLGFQHENQFIILHAFGKQSQKTPREEIALALRRKQAYLSSQR